MNFLLNTVKFIIYSNLLVSLCVGAYTHLTYTLFDLSSENALVVCTMVFCFTFTTYNGQRLFRLRNYHDIGERLQWVVKYKYALTVVSIITGVFGLFCAFLLGKSTWLILLVTGIVSLFYVVPMPGLKRGLRNIPYIKVFIIGLVWSLIIVVLPFVNASSNFIPNGQLLLGLASCFFFILAITLPFDVRDMKYDQRDGLKTLPQLFTVKGIIFLSEIALVFSFLLICLTQIETHKMLGLGAGYLITGIIVALSSEKKGELFYAGWVECTVLIIWGTTSALHFFQL